MTKLNLSATPRTVKGRKVKGLRAQGIIPANVFGSGISSKDLQINYKEFYSVFSQAGESSLIYLSLSEESSARPVLVSEVTKDPLTGQIIHVSFHQVDLKSKITAPVKLEFTGESPAIRDSLGVLVAQLDELEIEGLPTDMPDRLELDITPLAAVEDALFAKDVHLSSKLSLKTDPDALIVKIAPPTKEEVETPVTPEEGAPVTPGEDSKEQSEPAAKED
jgi:large subunit ribosomal protein L25